MYKLAGLSILCARLALAMASLQSENSVCLRLASVVRPRPDLVLTCVRLPQHRNLIIGGQDAPTNKYPYFAVFDHFGGGVLIAPDIVLTAGHVNPPLERNVQVRLNHTHFAESNFALELPDDNTYGISAIVRYPDYSTISGDENVHDFNLFVLDGLSKLPTVRLNRSRKVPRPGQIVTVVGMGSTSSDPTTFAKSAATTLQEVKLTVLSQSECLERSGHDPARPHLSYKGRLFEDSMICTCGGPHDEKDSCAFDSGSPLLTEDRYGRTVAVGLVSWGENCADPYFPSVNARVSFAMPWIDRVVCAISRAHPADLAEFGCDYYGDDDDFYWEAEMVPFRHYEQTYTARSGFNAILALLTVAGVGIGAVALRLAQDGHPNTRLRRRQSSMMRSSVLSIRSSVYPGEERLLSRHPAKAAQERSKDRSPEELASSVKSYDTFL